MATDHISTLQGKYTGECVWIVGKGPSLLHLSADDFGSGPVIAINHAIEHVEPLHLNNPTYSMQKDGECVRPQAATLLVHQPESFKLRVYEDYAPRLVFDNEKDFGIPQDSISAVTAIHLAKLMGCTSVELLCFDASTHGDERTCEGYEPPTESWCYSLQRAKIEKALNDTGLTEEWITPQVGPPVQFNITLPPHSCFGEIAETVVYALGELGWYAAVTNFIDPDATNIVLGSHLAPPDLIPDGTILYNFEQVGGFHFHPAFLDLARRCTVWDYSKRNIRRWHEYEVDAQYVPLGYVPQMTRVLKAPLQDVDVLFYGLMNTHRVEILEQVSRRGLRMQVLAASVTNAQRDDLISRAKVVLNLHYYETRLFEIARVSYLLANSKCVVSEHSADEDEYEYLSGGIALASPEGIADVCLSLVKHEARREQLERAGFNRFSAHRESQILAPVLESLACPFATLVSQS